MITKPNDATLKPPSQELRDAATQAAEAIDDLVNAGGSKDAVAMTLAYLMTVALDEQCAAGQGKRGSSDDVDPALWEAATEAPARVVPGLAAVMRAGRARDGAAEAKPDLCGNHDLSQAEKIALCTKERYHAGYCRYELAPVAKPTAEAKPAKWQDEVDAENVAFRFEVTAFFDSIQQRIVVAHSTSSEKAVACANYLETLEGVAFPQVREMDAVSAAPVASPKKTDWERVQSGEPWSKPYTADELRKAGWCPAHQCAMPCKWCANSAEAERSEQPAPGSRVLEYPDAPLDTPLCPPVAEPTSPDVYTNQASYKRATSVAEPPSPVAARQEECPHGIGLCTATCPSKKAAPAPVVGERDDYDVVQRALEFAVEEGIGGGPGWTNAGHAGNAFDVAMAAAERLKDSRDSLNPQLTTARSALEQASARVKEVEAELHGFRRSWEIMRDRLAEKESALTEANARLATVTKARDAAEELAAAERARLEEICESLTEANAELTLMYAAFHPHNVVNPREARQHIEGLREGGYEEAAQKLASELSEANARAERLASELLDVRELCSSEGCYEPPLGFAARTLAMVEELRQRGVCNKQDCHEPAPSQPLQDAQPVEGVAVGGENVADKIWQVLSRDADCDDAWEVCSPGPYTRAEADRLVEMWSISSSIFRFRTARIPDPPATSEPVTGEKT